MADLQAGDAIKIEGFRIREGEAVALLANEHDTFKGIAVLIDIFTDPIPVGHHHQDGLDAKTAGPAVDILGNDDAIVVVADDLVDILDKNGLRVDALGGEAGKEIGDLDNAAVRKTDDGDRLAPALGPDADA